MQNFRVTNKEHYRMLWYFLEWTIGQPGGSDWVITIIIIIITTIFINSLALLCQKKKLSSKQVQYNGKYKFRIDLNLTVS